MEIFQILAIGIGSGLLLSVVSIALFNSVNSERYPLGGFLPALWFLKDLGGSSQFVEVGCLIMGGLLGYYLVLTCWQGKLEILVGFRMKSPTTDHPDVIVVQPEETQGKVVIRGNELADFL